MSEIDSMIMHIRALVTLQSKIFNAFQTAFPEVQDWKFLMSCPKAGQLIIDGEQWSFKKHGAGLVFTSKKGVRVDMHRSVSDPAVFDAWRLLQYIESLNPQKSQLNEAELGLKLNELAGVGHLYQAEEKGSYRLNRVGS